MFKIFSKQYFIIFSILISASLIAFFILLLPFVLEIIQFNEEVGETVIKKQTTEVTDAEQIVTPQKIEFRIEPEVAIISESELLSTDDWKIYRDEVNGVEVKYPKDWHMSKNEYGLNFSTTPTSESSNNKIIPWARITFGIETKLENQTLAEWLKALVEHFGPGIDSTVQRVIIGEKKFLGTFPFNKKGWKNAYFDLGSKKILKLEFILKVEDVNFSKIFYSMIDSLKY